MSKSHEVLTQKRTLFGFKISDLLGIAIMVIPFIISILSFDAKARIIPFIPWITHTVKRNINPNYITAFCAAGFYCALIVRYGFFKKETLIEAIISSIRAFLDIWVLASLISSVITTGDNKAVSLSVFQFNTCTILLLAVILSWLGMKTIAGYSWIIFFLAGLNRLEQINQAMGMTGAVFIITAAISLFLQVENYANIKEFASDFMSSASRFTPAIKESMNAATQDATQHIQDAADFIKDKIPLRTGSDSSLKTPSLDLDAVKTMLDVNGDGVYDEKDIEIINQAQQRSRH